MSASTGPPAKGLVGLFAALERYGWQQVSERSDLRAIRPSRKPERRSARKARSSAGGIRRRASSSSGDDGSGLADDPPPPAQPQRRGEEQDRGTYTSRPRRTHGHLIGAHELVLEEIERLAGGRR